MYLVRDVYHITNRLASSIIDTHAASELNLARTDDPPTV